MEATQPKSMGGRSQVVGRSCSAHAVPAAGAFRDRVGARTYRAGDTIFGADDCRNRLYIVRQGWIRLFKSLPDGRAITFALLGPNSIVCPDEPGKGGSTAEAFVDCVVTEADVSAVVELVGRSPQLASAIIFGMQRRITQLQTMIEQLLVRDTSMRLAGALLMLEEAFGEPIPDSQFSRITTTITHQFLANMIGSNRVTVTRKLLDLQMDDRVKSLGRNSLAINVPALREFLNSKESQFDTYSGNPELAKA